MHSIDIRQLQRQGLLTDSTAYGWSWKNAGGKVMASITVRAYEGGVQFDYQLSGAPEVGKHIRLTTTACNYGGERVWFVCPYCSLRCALVYISQQVACRKCHQLKYPSQSDDEIDAAWRKQRKLEGKLGGRNYWQKPKGMHQATFNRIRREIVELEGKRDGMVIARYLRQLGSGRF